jgi:hypothetical protein
MKELTYTLLSDGSSDQALLPILTWLLRAQGLRSAIQPEWADLRYLPRPPRTLPERIGRTLELYPCDVLFVHRDAEAASPDVRAAEILQAIETVIQQQVPVPPRVCVIPVRMQEAWLLFDETAIRSAAGNRHGTMPLALPPMDTLEQLPDPKRVLYDLLRAASGLTGRRRRQFRAQKHTRRVAEFINDFSVLRALSAFNRLEADIGQIVHAHGWDR